MYHKNTNKDIWTALVTAGLGAGIVTSFAVSQGQHPLLALTITGIAALSAVLIERSGLL
ncbi:MAG: hypothetical protein RIG63_16450 [Coleofasciculus chthonoplastes F3-SA18-01]|uniref:hypothetical protein n=1 Tax=Coleofasciculus chthonoplastes TaxID=64178 RepID=UPI0032F9AB30